MPADYTHFISSLYGILNGHIQPPLPYEAPLHPQELEMNIQYQDDKNAKDDKDDKSRILITCKIKDENQEQNVIYTINREQVGIEHIQIIADSKITYISTMVVKPGLITYNGYRQLPGEESKLFFGSPTSREIILDQVYDILLQVVPSLMERVVPERIKSKPPVPKKPLENYSKQQGISPEILKKMSPITPSQAEVTAQAKQVQSLPAQNNDVHNQSFIQLLKKQGVSDEMIKKFSSITSSQADVTAQAKQVQSLSAQNINDAIQSKSAEFVKKHKPLEEVSPPISQEQQPVQVTLKEADPVESTTAKTTVQLVALDQNDEKNAQEKTTLSVADPASENEEILNLNPAQKAKMANFKKQLIAALSFLKNKAQKDFGGEEESQKLAYDTAQGLVINLEKLTLAYCENPTEKNHNTFKSKSTDAIKEARKVLDEHRDWKKIVLSVLAIIFTGGVYGIAAIIDRAISGKWNFFSTDSSRKIDPVEHLVADTPIVLQSKL